MPRGVGVRGWRKLSLASWRAPSDPQIFGDLDLDATAMLAFIEAARAATGERVTVTHLVARALAVVSQRHPELNGFVRGGRWVRRSTADAFFQVSTGRDLSGVTIREVDRKSAVDVARELREQAAAVRAGDDELATAKAILERTPVWLLRRLLRLVAWLSVDLGLDVPALGLRREPFGGVMVSSVASFGIERGFAPLAPYYKVPGLVLVGEVRDRPWVVDGEVVARPVVTLTATFDHRYLDGFHIGQLLAVVREYCADPASFEPPFS